MGLDCFEFPNQGLLDLTLSGLCIYERFGARRLAWGVIGVS